MVKIKGKTCGLVVAGRYERNVIWVRSTKKSKSYVEYTKPGLVFVFAPSKRKAVRAAHKANVRAVIPRGDLFVGIVGGWKKLARYQFKHGLPS